MKEELKEKVLNFLREKNCSWKSVRLSLDNQTLQSLRFRTFQCDDEEKLCRQICKEFHTVTCVSSNYKFKSFCITFQRLEDAE